MILLITNPCLFFIDFILKSKIIIHWWGMRDRGKVHLKHLSHHITLPHPISVTEIVL